MKHRPRAPEQDDLLRPRLVDMIDQRHELVKLAALIDWEVFEREWAGFFPSGKGRPATEPRLVAGLLYLQHAYRLSDEAVVARWVENPYYQHFTGETFFQHKLPIDPSSLTRWRGRIGEEGVEWLLTQTIRAGQKSGVINQDSVKRVAVDTTVMEKAIAYPTDARLYERARDQLVALAQEAEVSTRHLSFVETGRALPSREMVLQLAEVMRERGHDVSVLAPSSPDAELPDYVVSGGKAVPIPYNGSVARLRFGPATHRLVKKWIAAGDFDALVLDLMLPDGDGLDLCRELRSEARHRQLPLLMLT